MDTSLNPVETFTSADFGLTGNVNWDVSQGGIAAVILETDGMTATGRESITVRYDTKSPTAGEGDTVLIQAMKDGRTVTKKRTIFSVSWSLKFDGELHEDNTLSFDRTTGENVRTCEFNWRGERGADRVSAKMEATCSFSPTGIRWNDRGVTFQYAIAPGESKFSFRLQRKKIHTAVDQVVGTRRRIVKNEEDWNDDGLSTSGSTRYPTDAKPNLAFRTDGPGFDYFIPPRQLAQRADLREVAEWHTGVRWEQISISSEGEWHANITAVLPDGRKGGSNDHGPGGAEDVPNSRPVANAGDDRTVSAGDTVTLDGRGSSDADHDALTYEWVQTAGGRVTLTPFVPGTATFTAPQGGGTLTFELRVSDITKSLHHHNPGNGEGATADSVSILVSVF